MRKLDADKRCKQASDENKNAKDAEKHWKARSSHRAEEHDADSDTQRCRDVNHRRRLKQTNNADKNIRSENSKKPLYD